MKKTPITPKAKKCFGTGLAKGHGCGVETLHRVHGLCKMKCYSDWLLSSENGRLKMQRAMLVSKKTQQKAEKVKTRAAKDKLKTLSKYESEAKTVFQKFIRLRDANKACISCGITETKLWDGGHWKKAEIYSGLIFDERNCAKQCRKCNSYLGGNEGEYRIGLVNRFGEDFVKQLEIDANERRNYKYTKDELIEIKNKYLKKIKELR